MLFIKILALYNSSSLCAVSFRDVGDYASLQLPILSSFKQCLSPYYFFQSLFNHSILKFIKLVTCCFPLHFSISYECQIVQALLSHDASKKFSLSLCDSKYKCPVFVFIFHKTSLLLACFVYGILNILL